ncbi:low molecular weight protein-tyrosine-phosphatase [Arenimonas sp.]|uniref:low molecular weight protein-tyrosine-phosphatase n=1 Tax=Arenimonas sp. TaxID=1872635 RepID=UPI0039E293AA
MNRLLFVCLGNICRSPLMEGLVRAELRKLGRLERYTIDSAGLGAWHAGEMPDPRAMAIARQRGIDISMQRARALTSRDFQAFDLVLCADRRNLSELRRRAGSDADRCALFLDWSGVKAEGEVPDPYTGGAAEFELAYALIERGAQGLVRRLEPAGQAGDFR